ncbi:hypothetical protein SRHO_G00244220 [Serrasalmus rhombeus]
MKEMAAESSRRFTKNLLKPGSAAEIRQTASSAVRNSTVTCPGPLLCLAPCQGHRAAYPLPHAACSPRLLLALRPI